MIYNLALTLAQQPEVVERVLRVTRHRGFKITEMDMHLGDNGTTRLGMVVESERALELLSHQLNKLIDVTECKVLPTEQLATQLAHSASA
ncbi:MULTISPECIES: acetolactate synthase 2 small subunit [Shewanella]|uniref:Acetolactate synthase 2 small subunit n=1 Tax=Shewanella marisflavi TaxID=260364 RepID=A0AAC9TWE1_9GAMM|nr:MULTISPECIES: acetolactate synthase 2 small subunit [Shewanella]ASJ95351.1 acetolactate synthase 2 small subunit [Shewanella marisflavi]MCL1043246.1 acetolactate synthase 2 small subunit [Shewanella marisflavi]QDF73920.1 acetolactate synthase 2 small subunit [Shewanella marisflavi]